MGGQKGQPEEPPYLCPHPRGHRRKIRLRGKSKSVTATGTRPGGSRGLCSEKRNPIGLRGTCFGGRLVTPPGSSMVRDTMTRHDGGAPFPTSSVTHHVVTKPVKKTSIITETRVQPRAPPRRLPERHGFIGAGLGTRVGDADHMDVLPCTVATQGLVRCVGDKGDNTIVRVTSCPGDRRPPRCAPVWGKRERDRQTPADVTKKPRSCPARQACPTCPMPSACPGPRGRGERQPREGPGTPRRTS